MARVTRHTKSNRGRTYHCIGPCKLDSSEIVAGQEYYEWSPRSGVRRKHVECGYPRPSQLSSRKTAVVEDAIMDAAEAIGSWEPGGELELPAGGDATYSDTDCDGLKSILQEVASQAEDVGSEYEQSADNMPESLQYGTQAEAMRDVAGELESWASELTDWDPPDLDLPNRSDDESFAQDGDYQEACLEAIDAWKDEARSSAQDAMDDLPEYQA